MLSKKRVPNEYRPNAKILVVGEAPGLNDETAGSPFNGESGTLLFNVLGSYGVSRNDCSLANICQYRPDDNLFSNCLGTKELENSFLELMTHIRENNYNVIIALGAATLQILTGKVGIERFRGSILPMATIAKQKVIATFHPAFILRSPDKWPVFSIDIKRCVEDAKFPESNYTERNYFHSPKDELVMEEWTQKLLRAEWLAVDIESSREDHSLICIGFAPSANEAYVYPFTEQGIRHISRLLESAAKKIFHYGHAFDMEMLLDHGFVINEYQFDTYIAASLIEPEFEKTLAFLTSIYTREPYYKTEGRSTLPDNSKSWGSNLLKEHTYIYNAKDCCVTYEIFERQYNDLKKQNYLDFYIQEHGVALTTIKMSRNGIMVDTERLNLMKQSLLNGWRNAQFMLNFFANQMAPDITYVNVRSPKLKTFLYTTLGLPTRRNKNGITTDEDAIISLITYCQGEYDGVVTAAAKQRWEIKLAICKLILQIRGFRQLLATYILAKISADGRIRSVFVTGATETGRLAATKYVDDTGVNAQTFPRSSIDLDSKDNNLVGQLLGELDDSDSTTEPAGASVASD